MKKNQTSVFEQAMYCEKLFRAAVGRDDRSLNKDGLPLPNRSGTVRRKYARYFRAIDRFRRRNGTGYESYL